MFALFRTGWPRRTRLAWKSSLLSVVAIICWWSMKPAQAAGAKVEPGLQLTFRFLDGEKQTDASTAPNVSFYVEAGKPPTPFLPAGRFTATWEGFVNVDLRSDFFFQTELNGSLKLEINGLPALETSGSGGASAPGKVIQLKKGNNALRATFTSPEKGDAFVRLGWAEKGPFATPIAAAALSHASTSELETAARLRLGREFFLEHRCLKCHTQRPPSAGPPELEMDAPSFESIGARRNYDWMARWIFDPKAMRPTAQMPRMLRGPKAKETAEAMAAYLASLKSELSPADTSVAEPKPAPAAQRTDRTNEHQSLFEKLHCAACHNPPDVTEVDPQKISLTHVAEKFPPAKLAEFLRAPEAYYAWTRMPNFKLAAPEATELADFLLASAEKREEKAASVDGAILEQGRKLVQTSGCLNCHTLKVENQFSAPTLASLAETKWERGCLAIEPKADSKAPEFSLTAAEREALQAFGRTDRRSLFRHVPSEFAERQTRALRCNECHGKLDGFPPLEILGAKLRPEWAAKFIAGEIPYKPRAEKHPRGEPWLEARMPAFKSRAAPLAHGLSAQHGFPGQTPPESPVDPDLAKLGQKLVGKDGGFSCVSCHGIGISEATEVFESEGINFAYVAERLRSDYYRRWMRNPLSIDPQTKMPMYFEEGKTPLTEVLDGDAEKQITAIWEYLRLGSKMPPSM